jgi:hypothetical protein
MLKVVQGTTQTIVTTVAAAPVDVVEIHQDVEALVVAEGEEDAM